jgi:hypothetical protein
MFKFFNQPFNNLMCQISLLKFNLILSLFILLLLLLILTVVNYFIKTIIFFKNINNGSIVLGKQQSSSFSLSLSVSLYVIK